MIEKFLWSDDIYLVENAAWAAMELGSLKENVANRISTLLFDINQNRRVLIQSLASMGAISELSKIKVFLNDISVSPGVLGASISAVYKLCGERKNISKLEEHLFLQNQNDRHCAVEDIINDIFRGE